MTMRAREPWSVDPEAFPQEGTRGEQLKFLLRYAILAPSGHNTQPWRFVVDAPAVEVRADRRRSLPVVDPQDRALVISCGAAVGTVEVAGRRFGLDARTRVVTEETDPDLLAVIEFSTGAAPELDEQALFDAIPKRRTTRAPFGTAPVPAELLDACRTTAADAGVRLLAMEDEETRDAIARLVAEGDRLQFDDPAFRSELAAWVHSRNLGSEDGMSGASFGMPDLLSGIGRFVIRHFDLGESVAAGDEEKVREASPALALLASPGDTRADWLATGRALARVLLTLTAGGFSASFLNQPVETARLRPQLREAVGAEGFPQLLLRIGRAETVPAPTARRPLEEVLEVD